MARTRAGALLTQQHRTAQLALRAEVLRQLMALWPAFDVTDLSTFDRFLAGATTLVQARYLDSAALALAYLESFRRVEGVRSALDLRLPERPSTGIVGAALRGSGLLGTLNARRAGLTTVQAKDNGFVRLAGATTSLVLDGGRQTILEGIARDPEHPRWQRVTSGRACAFCAMLASRGPAYRSASRADFQAHDHCSCLPEPAFSGSSMPEASRQYRDQWQQATRGLSGTDALNAFRQSLGGSEAPTAADAAA